MKGLSFVLFLFAGYPLFAQQQGSSVDSGLVKEYFFTALKEKTDENYVKALESLNKITSIDPNNAAVYYETALLQMKLNKIQEAEVTINKAILLEPKNQWYLSLLVELYKRKGDMIPLIALYDRLIGLYPDREDHYFGRSGALAFSGKLKESLASYDQIEKKFGSSETLMKARRYLRSRLKEAPGGTALDKDDYLNNGSLMLQKGMPDSALAVFKKGKVIDPQGYELDIAIADAYLLQKKVPEASSYLKSALKIKTDDPKLYALYGDLLYQQGNLVEALSQYQLSIKLTDQLYFVWEHLVGIENDLGFYQKAIAHANAAIDIYPNQAVLYYHLAFAEHRNYMNPAALANLKTCLQLNGDNNGLNAMAAALQAEIFVDDHNISAAHAAFAKAMVLSPDNYIIYNHYAYYLAYKEVDLDKALKLVETSAKKSLPNGALADAYGYVLLKLKQYDRSKVWFEKALKNNGQNNAVVLEHYGDLLYLSGDKDQAIIQWLKAKNAGNDSNVLTRKINEKKYIK
jgi:tetratricopeptide (TPR) repeat protein